MSETIHCLSSFYRCLWMHFQHAWIGSLFGWCSRRCGEITSLDFEFSPDKFVFTSAVFWFYIGNFITTSSAVADDKLWSSPIAVLVFWPRHVIFINPWVEGFRHCGCGKLYLSWSSSRLNLDVAEGLSLCDSTVAATESANHSDLLLFLLLI